mgnify:CR=1 FL=1
MVPRHDNRNRRFAYSARFEIDKSRRLVEKTGHERQGIQMRRAATVTMLTLSLGGCVLGARVSPERSSLCPALDRFAASGLLETKRHALFYWPVSTEDTIPFTAAMSAEPMDDAARSFYGSVGRATHYFTLEALKAKLKACPVARRGRVRVEVSQLACVDRGSVSCLSVEVPARR